MRVVIVGGGIVGLASAYYLAQQNVDVVVCEKGAIGNGSTERSAGGIRTQFSTPVNVELSKASIDVWKRFEELFDEEISYRGEGYLFVAREEATVERFRENVTMQNKHGIPSEFLKPDEATEYCPGLRTDTFVGATFCGDDGFADPHLALQGFSRGAAEAGVDIRTKTPVTDVQRDDNTVIGVKTPEGSIGADFVVNAAGAWAHRISEMAGINLPIRPKRRQIAVVDPETPVPDSVPLTIDLDTGSYFRPEREGSALVGGHFGGEDPDTNPDDYSKTTDFDWTITAIERAAEWATYFGPESRMKRGWAGLYAVTPDHHAILEETVPGFITAAGFSGHGFQHAPATGKLVTELVTEGEASLVDISALQSHRFEEEATIREHNVA